MLTSFEDTFSELQPVTGTTLSTNVIFMGEGSEPSRSHAPIQLFAYVVEQFAGLTDLKLEVITSDTIVNNQLSSPIVVGTSRIYTLAELVRGLRFNMAFLPLDLRKYVGLRYVPTGTATAGRISSGLALDVQSNLQRSI